MFNGNELTPHGFCLLWEPGLIWLQAVSDALIALAYFSIPVALIVFVMRRSDIAFNWIFVLFAVFILACGATHIMEIVTLWRPVYVAQGIVKAVTAIASLGTAVVLWPLIPRALAIPSHGDLRAANARLGREIAERRATEDILRQTQKMESIGQLTGGIAHDFNNLLTIVMGSVERLQRRLPPDTAERRSADLAMEGALRAASLTARLLAFSRRQPLKPEPVDVNALVAGMTDLIGRTLGEQIIIETDLAPGLWLSSADIGQLEGAVLNLSINARDAMPGGGKLIIQTANVTLDQAYASANIDVSPGDYVLLSVSDTGTGMAEDTIAKAFEPFFTTKGPGQGTGLGLSQVYGFIKQSEGHVKIYSELGHGTAVKLYLPRLALAGAAPTMTSNPADLSIGSDGRKILVVEDDDAVRANTVELLRELGHAVVEAAEAQAAIRVLEADSGVRLLLTDVGLPGDLNGRQLADEALRRHPGIKVAFISGYAQSALVHQGRLDPDVDLLVKPYTFEALARFVHHVLREG